MKELIKECVKEILTGKEEVKPNEIPSITDFNLGKICMFRTYSAGVHFGTLVAKEDQTCLVKDSRRVYYWKKAASLSQLALEGDGDIENCKIAIKIPFITLEKVIEVIPMSDMAIEVLFGAKEWKV